MGSQPVMRTGPHLQYAAMCNPAAWQGCSAALAAILTPRWPEKQKVLSVTLRAPMLSLSAGAAPEMQQVCHPTGC